MLKKYYHLRDYLTDVQNYDQQNAHLHRITETDLDLRNIILGINKHSTVYLPPPISTVQNSLQKQSILCLQYTHINVVCSFK